MKFKWPFIAKILVPLCLCSALLAWQALRAQSARTMQAQMALSDAQARFNDLQVREARLRAAAGQAAKDDYSGIPIDVTIAAALNRIMDGQNSHAVIIDQIALGDGAVANAAAMPMREFSKFVEGTGNRVRIAKIKAKGSYGDYEQFRDYLRSCADLPVSMRALTVEGHTFEFVVEVLGS